MGGALAIVQEDKRHCLSGQFRFTEWVGPEDADAKVRAALAATEGDGIEVVDIHSRNGVVWAKLKHSAVPKEMLTWFEHFEKKGIPAAIVKNRVTGEYAIFREGVDSNADEDEDGPELLRKAEIMVLRKCNGYSLRLTEY
jgi:hypothetical protein